MNEIHANTKRHAEDRIKTTDRQMKEPVSPETDGNSFLLSIARRDSTRSRTIVSERPQGQAT